ncbi:MAG: hypothetical protein WCW44_03105 [archaeon]|jgi:hypothetical protein
MPFGLEYTGEFSSFGVGMLWILYSFAFFFIFTYLALRGEEGAWRTSLKITIYSLFFNLCLVWINFPPLLTAISGIAAYLVMNKAITHMDMNAFVKTTIIVYINFFIMLNIPDFLLLFYTIFSMYYFYAQSEARLQKNSFPGQMSLPQMPGMGM